LGQSPEILWNSQESRHACKKIVRLARKFSAPPNLSASPKKILTCAENFLALPRNCAAVQNIVRVSRKYLGPPKKLSLAKIWSDVQKALCLSQNIVTFLKKFCVCHKNFVYLPKNCAQVQQILCGSQKIVGVS
jgi:hypothetical protein